MRKHSVFQLIFLAFIILWSLSGFACATDSNTAPPEPSPESPPPPPPPPPPPVQEKAGTGLYLGVIGFNDTLSKSDASILNIDNKSQVQEFIANLEIGSGTGLYYAVDNAISMLAATDLPDDLISVSIVTFTDGLDNISIDLNPDYNSRDDFRDGVQNRIAETTIKDLPIRAYSIGIQGGDVRDSDAFRAGLMALATTNSENPLGRNVYFAENLDEVIERFGDIASSLYQESQLQSIRLRMTGGYDDGTRIRFTFDEVTDTTIENSGTYIEGTYRRVDGNRLLEDVVFRGLNNTDGITLNGELKTPYVYFSIDNETPTLGVLLDMEKAQQWEYLPSLSLWQRNSEFDPLSDSQIVVTERSAVVILVLDCTTSLNAGEANGFEQMKAAADKFLDTLKKSE